MKTFLLLLSFSLAIAARASDGVTTPAEFAPTRELQMTAETFSSYTAQFARLQGSVGPYLVIVDSEREASELQRSFRGAGGRAGNLVTRVLPYNSFWFQDFGPIYVRTASGIESRDFTYTRHNRTLDDAIPEGMAELDGTTNEKVDLNFEGGNFISDGRGTCFTSTRIYEQNPGVARAEVQAAMKKALGCERLVTLAPLVDDVTFHIDLFAKLVDARTFIVGDFVDHPVNKGAMDRNARALSDLGYKVHRLPVRSVGHKAYATHLNSFLVNGTVLLPSYGIPEDAEAATLYRRLGYNVEQLPAAYLIANGGSLHCILRSRPK